MIVSCIRIYKQIYKQYYEDVKCEINLMMKSLDLGHSFVLGNGIATTHKGILTFSYKNPIFSGNRKVLVRALYMSPAIKSHG